MSILDDDLQNQSDIICYEQVRDRIEEFVSKYMNGLWSDQYMGMRNDGTPCDTSCFLYGYNKPNETLSNQRSYVYCSFPILCEYSLVLYYVQDIHSRPFVIHDYPGEELPNYIRFACQQLYEDAPTFDMDEGYKYVSLQKMPKPIPIYIHNCPNLKKRGIDESLNFIEL